MSGVNTPTGVTPSVSGEDGSALMAAKDPAEGDAQSAHTPRQPFSFTALPSHLSIGGDSAPAPEAHVQATPGASTGVAAVPNEERLKAELATHPDGCGMSLCCLPRQDEMQGTRTKSTLEA
jgi:hypothetical protein